MTRAAHLPLLPKARAIKSCWCPLRSSDRSVRAPKWGTLSGATPAFPLRGLSRGSLFNKERHDKGSARNGGREGVPESGDDEAARFLRGEGTLPNGG